MRGDGRGDNRSKGCWRAALAALLLWSPEPGQAAAVDDPSSTARQAAVAEILDGDTIALADGRRVRLAGVMAPKPPLGRSTGARWRMADEATAALSALALGRVVALHQGAAETDRYGHIVAQLYRDDGLWLQGEMLRRGLARVASNVDDRALVPEMLELERAARAARLGVWRDGFYAIRSAEEAGRFIESFQLVEGTIAEATKVKGQIFLNLGADWHSAFTIRIPRGALALFKESGLDPVAWKGARVRVRGWIRLDRRPIVDATHPEQIELLDAP